MSRVKDFETVYKAVGFDVFDQTDDDGVSCPLDILAMAKRHGITPHSVGIVLRLHVEQGWLSVVDRDQNVYRLSYPDGQES